MSFLASWGQRRKTEALVNLVGTGAMCAKRKLARDGNIGELNFGVETNVQGLRLDFLIFLQHKQSGAGSADLCEDRRPVIID